MANTRFFYDPCRTKKHLQQATDPGRYILNVPGNGSEPYYIEDPQIIIQKWGANLRTNTIDLESELRGVNRQASRDCLAKDLYTNYNVPNHSIQYPTTRALYTEQSRAIMPAWTARDLEQVDWYTLPLNPQENTCFPFENNLSTRILEKDYYQPKQFASFCNFEKDTNTLLPVNIDKPAYAGGPTICTTSDSCGL